jgi:uncharacterized protein involved in exopolysaccharide biosynthesis
MFKRFWWVFLVMAVALPIVGLPISATITYLMPKKFESTATIQFYGEAAKGIDPGAPGFQILQDHIQTMKSDEILQKVAWSLDLSKKWGNPMAEILQMMREAIRIEQRRGTELVDIIVRHTNRTDAREIAAEVVKTYRGRLKELDKAEPEMSLARLKAMLPEQEKIVEQRERELQAAKKSLTDKPVAGGVEDRVQLEKQKEYESAATKLHYAKLMIRDPATFRMLNEPIIHDTIIIHKEPVIGTIPVSPDVRFNILSGVIGGLLLSPLLSLPVIWLLNRVVKRPYEAPSPA